ncbi:hypothetical protein MRB53_029799 [Persea americana]|uniref:Uncharacterized protein n=1 Tax=Persea americana TaxID=3435 RepID=A0ACC2KJE4_PERAE|nr:hypothetical protein MRB53_029799 [Persea americana]
MVLGAAALIIVFVLRPRKPTFALQALRLDSLRLNTTNGSSIYASSVFSLLFNAQNPNKVGIRYSPSQLCVLYRGIPVGVAKLPEFYQPAHSKNVSVQTQVMFDRVNVSQIIHGDPSKGYTGKSLVTIRVTGDIKALVRVLHVTLPKIKVALDCMIGFDYRKIIFSKSIHFKKEHKVLSHSRTYSEKCSFTVYI